jgi:L-ornithine N5-monooxygenase
MPPSPYDVLGIGFGPANVALAIALDEDPAALGAGGLSHLFLEAKPTQVWHPGLLLEGSKIQITVLKDLVTPANPQSRFSFLCYLQERGRLFEFLNLRDLFPTRQEFNDYFCWVSEQLGENVRYGQQVESVLPVDPDRGPVELLAVRTRDRATGRTEEHLTRNLVVATGGVPKLPAGIRLEPNGRAFHAHEFMPRMRRDFADTQRPWRFVVIGSGQTGAELFDYLMQRYPNADITAAIRRYAFKPVDESDFTNEIFFPQNVDLYYNLPDAKRAAFLETLKDVNYAVVDHPLIRRIYRNLYDERVEGRNRARVLPFQELERLEERPGSAVAHFRNVMSDETLALEADAVIVASGYERPKRHPLLAALEPFLEPGPQGGFRMERDYAIATRPGFAPRVYLQGDCEESHGISETVLSLVAIRAQDILASLHRHSPATQPATPTVLAR